MKCGMRMAGAVGVGYLLGRTRKMKLALMLAGVGVSGRGGPQALLERTTSAVGVTPELTKITETIRGELLDAARAAAITAAGNRIDALNARLQQHGTETSASDGDDEPEPVDENSDTPDRSDDRPPRGSRTTTRTRASATGTRRRTEDNRARTPTRTSAQRGTAAERPPRSGPPTAHRSAGPGGEHHGHENPLPFSWARNQAHGRQARYDFLPLSLP